MDWTSQAAQHEYRQQRLTYIKKRVGSVAFADPAQ